MCVVDNSFYDSLNVSIDCFMLVSCYWTNSVLACEFYNLVCKSEVWLICLFNATDVFSSSDVYVLIFKSRFSMFDPSWFIFVWFLTTNSEREPISDSSSALSWSSIIFPTYCFSACFEAETSLNFAVCSSNCFLTLDKSACKVSDVFKLVWWLLSSSSSDCKINFWSDSHLRAEAKSLTSYCKLACVIWWSCVDVYNSFVIF